jgi:hypothetical protein
VILAVVSAAALGVSVQEMLVGGRDGGRIRLVEETTGDDLLAVSLWGVDSREISGLLEVREGEALDASLDGVDYRLGRSLAEYRSLLRVAMADDVVLRLAHGQDCKAKAERAERLQAASALLDNDILSGRQQAEAAGKVGDEYRCFSAYYCEGDSTGAYCGVGASGVDVHVGMVACRASETKAHKCFTVADWPGEWCCEDTGGPRVEYDGCLDFWAFNLDEALEHLPPQRPGGFIRWLSP